MRSTILLLVIATACAFPAATAAGPSGGDEGTMCVQNTALSPANEIRTEPVTDPVTSTATGHAQIKVRNDGTIEFKVFINNPDEETFVAGHIHEGAATANGPVRVTLFSGSTSERTLTFTGELSASQTTSANFAPSDVCTDPAGHYVNFHTTVDPQGATRGQLG